jgi:hypothetical protein
MIEETTPTRFLLRAWSEMSRHHFFPMVVAVPLIAAGSSCEPSRPTPPVTKHTEPVQRPGIVEIDLAEAEAMKTAVVRRTYVPAYSHYLSSDESHPYRLSVTLSVRNSDDTHPLVVRQVHYHDQDGKLVHEYLKKPLKIAPLAAVDFFVKPSDTAGGTSVSLLVDWSAEEGVTEPVVEAVMIGTAGNQGISFLSIGRVLPSVEANR